MARKKQTQNERDHGHCADELMRDYGVPKTMRVAVCDEIARIYRQGSLIHCVIITSVRGYNPQPHTRGLQVFLERHATRAPKNRKPEPGGEHRGGRFNSRGEYVPY